MAAKSIFERQARVDPLHALGIGSMVFFKAIMVRSVVRSEFILYNSPPS